MGDARAGEFGPHLPRMPRADAAARVETAFPSTMGLAPAALGAAAAQEHPRPDFFDRPQRLVEYAAQLKVHEHGGSVGG